MVAMTPSLGLWLEAAAGYSVPPECYAAVRQGEAKGPVPPTYCVPHKVSCVGRTSAGNGPVVVDIFQRVGSVTLGSVEPGALVEATVDWPGRSEVRLRISVVPVGEGTEVPVLAHLPQVTAALDLEDPAHLITAKYEEAEARTQEDLPEPPVAKLDPGEKEGEACPSPIPPTIPTSPKLGVQPAADNQERLYKPISLNNCNQIIPNLYLGGVQAVADTQSVVDQGIRAVCCCLRNLEFPDSEFHQDLSYYRVDVEDMGAEPIELYYPEATEFIHSWVSREQPVLVHCRAGVSRSASVVMAYLIKYQGYNLHDAFFLVRAHRSVVSPNIGFMEKLGDFEEEVRSHEPTIDIGKYEGWYTSPERAAVPDLKPDF